MVYRGYEIHEKSEFVEFNRLGSELRFVAFSVADAKRAIDRHYWNKEFWRRRRDKRVHSVWQDV